MHTKHLRTFNTPQQLSLGFAITSASETLQRVMIEDIVALISGEKTSSLKQEVARLQKLRTIDKTAYRNLKTRLPYLVGSVFKGNNRRAENLEAVNFLILDIDNLSDFDGQIPEAIKADDTVMLAFVSPSGEGIKVLFRLESTICPTDGFQTAYRDFAENFGVKVGLTGFVDLKTSDVSRACFLSYDENVYFNPSAIAIKLELNNDLVLFETDDQNDSDIQVMEKPMVKEKSVVNQTAYKAILKEINPNTLTRPKKDIIVPNEISLLEPELEKLCTNAGFVLLEKQPIQYGIKIMAKQGYRKAEVNIFYGKKGYSVVISPKTGTDKDLNELLHGILYNFLFPSPIVENITFADFISQN
ncbi:CRISPR-associated primase-polymerase type B [Arcicella aquatica]|uniref:CRISPR-associated primase-polymerase type B n=1 Tax=Arcicella aquatica TaxID=217141 RepID=A0ABU5QR30_9BACT|nr:CRISPR-associated primase-polymerase type B [Arcicella aquatica]MEA5259545.1 CRISPR-associated primase-polymerase type B [Arcicella aquatica]